MHVRTALIAFAMLRGIGFGEITCQISYDHQNQVDYHLWLRRIRGVAIDDSSTPVPKTCLGIFTEPDHHLFTSVETNDRGRFVFHLIKPGKYRLVAKYDSMGVANVILEVGAWPSGGIWRSKLLYVHLRPRGLDTPSFVDLKRTGN